MGVAFAFVFCVVTACVCYLVLKGKRWVDDVQELNRLARMREEAMVAGARARV